MNTADEEKAKQARIIDDYKKVSFFIETRVMFIILTGFISCEIKFRDFHDMGYFREIKFPRKLC